MAVALAPIPSRGRRDSEASLRLVPPRPAYGTRAPYRPLSETETDPRCRPPRPTRVGCTTEELTARRGAAVRRRRVLLGTVAAGLLAVLALPWSGTGGTTLATPGSALAGDTVAHHARYIVQAGDTLWSIATRLDPSGDPRPVVAQLAARLGSDTPAPGERVVLP